MYKNIHVILFLRTKYIVKTKNANYVVDTSKNKRKNPQMLTYISIYKDRKLIFSSLKF